jgi:DNA-binding IclR family transcriptional regulator
VIAVRVFLFLLPDLDPIEYRGVRQAYVAKALRLPQSRVSSAIARLVRDGLLEETDRRVQFRDRSFVKQYRLNSEQPELARFLAFARGTAVSPRRDRERAQLS